VTAVFVAFSTVAVNCCWPPVNTSAVVGEIDTETGRITVTLAVLDLVGSATDVAVTATCAGEGAEAGAV
jgi:hypothetical protein